MKQIIGMRILKTALAVAICVFLSQLLHLEYPFYVVIAAIISMESSITSSFKAGRNRLAGTLVGALTGLLFATLQPGNALLCGLGTIVLIYVCEKFHWNNSITIAGIVFIAIMVNLDGRSPVLYGLNRILDTTIGISVALLINYLIFPPNIGKMVAEQYGTLVHKLNDSAALIENSTEEPDLEKIHEEIEALSRLIQAHGKDIHLFRQQSINVEEVQEKLKVCRNVLHHLSVLQDSHNTPQIESENGQVLKYHQQKITQHLQLLQA